MMLQWCVLCFLGLELSSCGMYGRRTEQADNQDNYQQYGQAKLVGRNAYYARTGQEPPPNSATMYNKPHKEKGLSAGGLIALLTFVIVLGFVLYYGIICYPVIFQDDRRYNMMVDVCSTSAESTSTQSSDFGKLALNYSSRCTTPTSPKEIEILSWNNESAGGQLY